MSHEEEVEVIRSRFRGDRDRNEVQMDLPEFVRLLTENNDLKEKIRSLEVEGTTNPWVRWIHFARAIDAWRIFPRLFITVYMYLLLHSSIWFMGLPAPTLEQSGLISIIVGAGAAWFGMYCTTGGGKASKTALDYSGAHIQ